MSPRLGTRAITACDLPVVPEMHHSIAGIHGLAATPTTALEASSDPPAAGTIARGSGSDMFSSPPWNGQSDTETNDGTDECAGHRRHDEVASASGERVPGAGRGRGCARRRVCDWGCERGVKTEEKAADGADLEDQLPKLEHLKRAADAARGPRLCTRSRPDSAGQGARPSSRRAAAR
jgi:hypothetical protein